LHGLGYGSACFYDFFIGGGRGLIPRPRIFERPNLRGRLGPVRGKQDIVVLVALKGRIEIDEVDRLGRFWRRGPAPARQADGDPGRLQVRTGRLAPDARRRLNAAERPAEPAQRQDLLLRSSPKMLAMFGGEPTASPSPSTS
jgi:hypothetical protein